MANSAPPPSIPPDPAHEPPSTDERPNFITRLAESGCFDFIGPELGVALAGVIVLLGVALAGLIGYVLSLLI